MDTLLASFVDDRHGARTCQKIIFKIAEGSLGHELRAVCFGAAFDARSNKICHKRIAHA